MKKIIYSLLFIIGITTAYSCSEANNGDTEGEKTEQEQNKDPEADPDKEPDKEPETETDPEPEYVGDYAKGVTVESFTETFDDGKVVNGYYAIIDFAANDKLKFTVSKAKPQKPSAIYANFDAKKGKPCVVTNGGYFAGSTPVSLGFADGRLLCHNSMEINWPNDENYEYTVYPVRSALGVMKDGSMEIQWVYYANPLFAEYYSFPSTMGNNEKTKTFITEKPTKEAEGAEVWRPVDAIGGGPRLVKNFQDVAVSSYWGEVLNSGGTAGLSRQPRTAIGITKDGKMILLVCDGRGRGGSSGYTLSEMAQKMIELGAIDAMNLDGGGSSVMIGKDGAVLNDPSDNGVERNVPTTVVIYEKI